MILTTGAVVYIKCRVQSVMVQRLGWTVTYGGDGALVLWSLACLDLYHESLLRKRKKSASNRSLAF